MTSHKNSMVVGDGECGEELEQQYTSTDTKMRPSEFKKDAKKIPCIGMNFKTLDEVFLFYNEYAKVKGFGVRKSSSRLSKKDKSIIAKRFCCSKEGFRERKRFEGDGKSKAKSITRCGCGAHIVVNRRESGSEGLWEITEFVSDHSHELHSSATIQFVRSHKRLNTIHKRVIQKNYGVGIGPSKIHKVFAEDVGGEKNVPFSQRDIQNFISNERKKSLKCGDARAALQFCEEMKKNNLGFFYMVDVDDEGKLNKFFWVDAKSRIAFNHYGDVVSIDSTYKTNRYDMPFVLFVGCNNHRQSIVFGAGLLCNETIDSYIWIFNAFLNAMNKVAPRVIITDQDAAISNAVHEVFPMTKHHLCRWHIVSKVEQKMASVIQKDKEFKKEFNDAYLFGETIEEFETKWSIILKKHSNVWMDSIYALRQKWVPAFTREVFTAGMSTTQRSESLNGFFKTYVSKRATLREFLEAYGKALEHQYHKECEAGFRTLDNIPLLMIGYAMEQKARSRYTSEVFKLFQAELALSIHYCSKENGMKGRFKIFIVWRESENAKKHLVKFNGEEETVLCSCRKFESEGILCRHALKTYLANNIFDIPNRYILARWTRDHAEAVTVGHHNGLNEECKGLVNLRYVDLCSRALRIVEEGALEEGTYEAACSVLDKCYEELLCMKREKPNSSATCKEKNFPREDDYVGAPPKVISRGRPSNATRLKTSVENVKAYKSYSCSICGGSSHNARTCGKRNKRKLE